MTHQPGEQAAATAPGPRDPLQRAAVALRSMGQPDAVAREFDFRDDRYEGRRLFSELLGTFLLVFVAAGGYHHHVGFNTWRGPGVPPTPDGVVGLRRFIVVLRDQGELDALRARAQSAGRPIEEADNGLLLRDPSGNALLFRAG